MKKTMLALVAGAALAVTSMSAFAQKKDPDVGGAPMYPNKTVVANASTAPNLSTLVAAVKAAGLVDTLNGPGPFTVFAPTNDAFGKLPSGTVDTLTQPENKAKLTAILTYHVVPGKYDSKKLMKEIKSHNGSYQLKTVAGGMLTFSMDGSMIKITDEKGGSAEVTTADVYQPNGVAHVIDTVLMPS
jgi:uncharacterized surface protein with fasciclin (FAS1) repeats